MSCVLAMCLAVLPAGLRAQGRPDVRPDHDLTSVEAALAASRADSARLAAAASELARQVADLQARLVARAATARGTESELSRLERQLTDLESRRTALQGELAARRQALLRSLAALERMAMMPPGAALVSAAPLDIARGEILLRVAVPELQRRSRLLEADIAQMLALAREIGQRRDRAATLAAGLDADRQQIALLLAEKARLQQQTAADAAASSARSARLAAEAKDLHDLLDRLARERPVPPPAPPDASAPVGTPGAAGPALAAARPFPALPGPASAAGGPTGLVAPVTGSILEHFGELDATGSKAKGILIQARPGATVLAPFDGQVVFRGPFRSYGEILIIQHAGGYHSLLAGLGRSDAAVGQWVVAGEPVGVMGPAKDGDPKLYVELRRDGHPIDPAPWLGKSVSNLE